MEIGRRPRSGGARGGATVALVLVLAAACTPGPEGPAAGDPAAPGAGVRSFATSLRVAATTPALAWLVERIGGAAARVERLGPEWLDPARTPTAEEVLQLSAADLIVTRGRRIETWLETASLPESRLVETTDGMGLLVREGPTHSHGTEGEHSHWIADPATPLDPELFAAQARSVHQALVRAAASAPDPDPDPFATAAAGLAAELEELAAGFRAIGGEWSQRGVDACAAPADRLGYACRALGLPAARSEGAAQPARTLVLWPLGVPDPPMAVDTVVVPLDPLELPPGGDPSAGFDYLGRQRANLERLRAGLGAGS
ncbi:MAG TPA: metal ABC transporter substrate-binding protein [Thermoanaerobaculia bacterium]|nr:metal ABC transporter substrate-binding protein [Thermoanaerobaculia bacterium]